MSVKVNTPRIKFFSIEDKVDYDSVAFFLAGEPDFLEVQDPGLADVLVFNGGRDIGSEIYDEASVHQGVPFFKSARDIFEISLFNDNVKRRPLMLGICRGAQLLNCLNGGKLWQHVTNHQGSHQMIDMRTSRIYQATSTHHQMMRPAKWAQIIGISNEAKLKVRANERRVVEKLPGDITEGNDVEICWYKATRSLCIQGHPEYVPGSKFANYCLDLIREHLNDQAA